MTLHWRSRVQLWDKYKLVKNGSNNNEVQFSEIILLLLKFINQLSLIVTNIWEILITHILTKLMLILTNQRMLKIVC